MEVGSSGSLKSDINVTPLVDVMLVMLIIFMLVTPLLQSGVGVTLPEARNVQPVSENEEEIVVIALTAGGQVYAGRDPISKERVEDYLRRRRNENSGVQMQIRADRNARFKDVRELVRAGREAGFESVALIADEIKDYEQTQASAGAPQGGH